MSRAETIEQAEADLEAIVKEYLRALKIYHYTRLASCHPDGSPAGCVLAYQLAGEVTVRYYGDMAAAREAARRLAAMLEDIIDVRNAYLEASNKAQQGLGPVSDAARLKRKLEYLIGVVKRGTEESLRILGEAGLVDYTPRQPGRSGEPCAELLRILERCMGNGEDSGY